MAGERTLYELRRRKNLTLQQASEAIGIDKSTLCRYEQHMPEGIRPEVMAGICRLYGVSPEVFREEAGACWFRILSPEEVAEAYRLLDDRGRLRLSRMLARERDLLQVSGGKP